jgi:signal transduction histidine kinase/CheY-like chemotaxis protein
MATRHLPDIDTSIDHVRALEARIVQLSKINAALVDRVERSSDIQGGAFSMFETAISLEALVRERTAALEDALERLAKTHADLDAAHREAEATRARLRDAIESLSDGFALYDAQDRLVMCNRAYLGFWPDLADLGGDPPRFDEIAKAAARNRRALGALNSPERWVAERLARHALADGVHIQALTDGRWVQINEIRTSEGGTVGIYTDITEVKAEDARERARELAEHNLALQATLDTLAEGACLFDAQRRLLVSNGELERLLSLPPGDHSAIGTHERFAQHCRQLGIGHPKVIDWRPAPGERHEVQCALGDRQFVIRSTPIEPAGMAYSFEDVTDRLRAQMRLREAAETLERRVAERTTELEAEVAERRAIEAELLAAKTAAEHANRSKTSFLAAASHDLLQPLNAARLFVAALSERRLALPTRALVRQTGVALDSVEDLLEALLEISRLDAGAIQPEIAPIELDRMLAALRIEFAPLAKSAGLSLTIPETGLWLLSDVRLLRRILQNFLSNALRYTREGSVTVDVTPEGDDLRIAVRDTGPGIEPSQFSAVFEEFRRLDRNRAIPGKGLGLAIVRRASAMLGHRIDLESEPGKGATFAVWVPLTQATASAHPAPRSRSGNEAGTTTGAVLVIDNDEAILAGAVALLRNWGFDPIAAKSPDDPAAQAAISRGVALILADYHLDHGTFGDDAVAALRKAAGRDIPSVIITADRTEDVKARLAAAKLPVLNKPIKPAQLRALMRNLLD